MALRRKSSDGSFDDPDPMMRALYDNLLALETKLRTLHGNAANFVKSVNFIALNMLTTAANIEAFCVEDEALRIDTKIYSKVMNEVGGRGPDTVRCHTIRNVELKVLEPLNVNLIVLQEIKARMGQREIARKAQRRKSIGTLFDKHKNKQVAASEFAALTQSLFEELTTVHLHRVDFVRSPYQALKRFQ